MDQKCFRDSLSASFGLSENDCDNAKVPINVKVE